MFRNQSRCRTVIFANGVSQDGINILNVCYRTEAVLLKTHAVPAQKLKFYLKQDEKLP